MRIAGGDWRGRPLKVPSGEAVRPTQDRVREALFSMIQPAVPGAVFLDLFAGSGGVGLEALSRGAARAVFVERVPRHVACLTANAATLKAEARTEIIRADAETWPASGGVGRRVDIAFADPPYDHVAAHGYTALLTALAEHDVVRPEGLFIAEMRATQTPDEHPAWELCRDRTYGEARLAVYRRRGT